MIENKIVLPGDQVSTSEELSPGEGTFEEDGIIRAARLGVFSIDKKFKKALVKPLTSIPVMLKKGDIVLAEVTSVRSNMVIANVIHVVGEKRQISGDTNGTLHVSEISKGYVKDPSSEYAPGDIIRARITQVKPSLQLETRGRELGVIKAMCTRCRHPLVRKGNILECENCRNRERRKTAIDYGEYDLNKF
ncbi:MAG: RNA-binding protein [Thermoplasmata archaeon]|nr:MAG: RNA-binding protein [Thermoplasmata archaeon]RLF50494.1 MAG: RNA-binding protein [Thermoplasmata archaeon]